MSFRRYGRHRLSRIRQTTRASDQAACAPARERSRGLPLGQSRSGVAGGFLNALGRCPSLGEMKSPTARRGGAESYKNPRTIHSRPARESMRLYATIANSCDQFLSSRGGAAIEEAV